MTMDELQALIDKATPGPWCVYWYRPHIKGEPYRIDGDGDERILRWGAFMKPKSNRAAANARLIALAPQLAAENISLRQEIQRLREHVSEHITFAETRIQDGIDLGATVWRLALEDIAKENRAALSSQENKDGR